jgi:PTS system nitrogen regulatory IIA component
MQLTTYLTIDRILSEMRATTKEAALLELAELVSDGRNQGVRDRIIHVLQERERLASTGIGDEIAIPHGKLEMEGPMVIGLARSRSGLDFESVDGKPARLFFVLVASEKSTGIHLKALARISRLCKEPGFRQQLLEAPDSHQMYEIIRREDTRLGER